MNDIAVVIGLLGGCAVTIQMVVAFARMDAMKKALKEAALARVAMEQHAEWMQRHSLAFERFITEEYHSVK